MSRSLTPMTLSLASAALLAAGAAGCSSDRRGSGQTAAPVTTAQPAPTATASAVEFEVVVENLSDQTSLPSPFSPGYFIVHDASAAAFVSGAPDAGLGLEALAEDGDASALRASLALDPGVASEGQFGAIAPGARQTFVIQADPSAPLLSLGTMLVQSNDAFAALQGVALFDAAGAPIGTQTLAATLYDAGTEANEPFGRGANQPPRQSAANTGPREGVVQLLSRGTRVLPRAARLVEVSVSDAAGGELVIRLTNRAEEAGLSSPFAPLFYATHGASFALFQEGSPAALAGLETLAEDGSPAGLVAAAGADPAVDAVGVVNLTTQRPNDPPGPLRFGETYELRLTPSASAPRLSLASMLGQSNDWFLSTPAGGIELFDASGARRSAGALQAELARELDVFDAGTERNEVLGAGSNQAPRQSGPNTGPSDPDDTVRRVRDTANDLAGSYAGSTSEVRVSPLSGGRFEVELINISAGRPYPIVLSPLAWELHPETGGLFRAGQAAGAGLEALAEDGDASALVSASPQGAVAGVIDTPVGAQAAGPLRPGERYRFVVTPDATRRYLSLASMLVPSNDAFVALGERGVALLDSAGQPRPASAIAADVARALGIWDAGTEGDEVGGAGPNQAPAQAAPNTGPAAGAGTVRPFADPLWQAPATDRLIRITVRPR